MDNEIIRLIQPNLRKIDAIDLDVEKLIHSAASFGANAIILNAGGFIAWYPTKLPFQKVNEYLTFDYLGTSIEIAHRHKMKICTDTRS